jgi:hypothetical protein
MAARPGRHHNGRAAVRAVLLAVVLAAVTLVAAASSASATALSPAVDPFYAAPANLADVAPGDVIRSRTTHVTFIPGQKLPFTTYQVLYRTNDLNGTPIADVATIILPTHRPATGRDLVSYQTAYDGVSPGCQPSYSLQTGGVVLQDAEVLLMMGLLNRGWTVVTTDYEGPDNSWLVGQTTAHGVLDGIRAAERYAPAGLTDGAATKVGMMGYSGGGQATAWANEMARTYAPELNIVGAAQGGVAVSLMHAFRALDGNLFAGIAFAALTGMSNAYPNLNFPSYLSNKGRAVTNQLRTKYSCITDFAFPYAFQRVRSLLTVADPTLIPGFTQAAEANSLGKGVPAAPIYWYQTVVDEMDGYASAKRLAKQYCLEGTQVEFFTDYFEEHAMQAFSMPFKAQSWLADRFHGVPVHSTCSSL